MFFNAQSAYFWTYNNTYLKIRGTRSWYLLSLWLWIYFKNSINIRVCFPNYCNHLMKVLWWFSLSKEWRYTAGSTWIWSQSSLGTVIADGGLIVEDKVLSHDRLNSNNFSQIYLFTIPRKDICLLASCQAIDLNWSPIIWFGTANKLMSLVERGIYKGIYDYVK